MSEKKVSGHTRTAGVYHLLPEARQFVSKPIYRMTEVRGYSMYPVPEGWAVGYSSNYCK